MKINNFDEFSGQEETLSCLPGRGGVQMGCGLLADEKDHNNK